MPIVNYEKRLQTALDHLDKIDITTQNKQDIKAFLDYLAAHGGGTARQCKYIYPLENLARWLQKDFMRATKADIERLVKQITGNPEYTEWTKQDYMVVIKKFYKWLYNKDIEDEDDWEIPKLVKFIKIHKPKDARTIPSDLLTVKEVRVLADATRTLRERALVLTMYETGARIGELLNLRIKDVEFDDYGAKVRLVGKTGPRWIRVVGSAPALSQWLTGDHPRKNQRDSFVFCTIRPESKAGSQLGYAALKKILKQLQARTDITKNIRPHLWRHARATELAEHLTDAQRCKYFGWVDGSEMARIYTHLVDTERTILELNGLVKKEKDRNGKFNAVICPRCETRNPYGAKVCATCVMGLDEKSLMEYEERKAHATDMGLIPSDLTEITQSLKEKDQKIQVLTNRLNEQVKTENNELLQMKKKYEELEDDLRKIMKTNPDKIWTHFTREAWEDMKKTQEKILSENVKYRKVVKDGIITLEPITE